MTTFDLILHFSLVLSAVRLRAKFEVSGYNSSRDIGVPNLEK